VVGRAVQLNKHPFTIVGVTPPGFRGSVLIFSADLFVLIVNQEDGASLLDDRGNHWIGSVVGHPSGLVGNDDQDSGQFASNTEAITNL